jgi:hypothetical protein
MIDPLAHASSLWRQGRMPSTTVDKSNPDEALDNDTVRQSSKSTSDQKISPAGLA